MWINASHVESNLWKTMCGEVHQTCHVTTTDFGLLYAIQAVTIALAMPSAALFSGTCKKQLEIKDKQKYWFGSNAPKRLKKLTISNEYHARISR